MYKFVVLLAAAGVACAEPGVVVPGSSSVSQYSSSVVHGGLVPALYSAPVVSAYSPLPAVALSQPPHSPAVVLDAARGVPLDTAEVVAARAVHYQAKALSGFHHLRKRSVAYTAPVAYSAPVVPAYSAPVVSAYSAAPVVSYSSSVLSPYASAVLPKAYSVHPY